MKLKIIFATGNRDKLREIGEIIEDPEVTLLSMKEAGVAADPEENGTSFEENAVIKAEAVYDLVRKTPSLRDDPETPVIVMSDDSGLVIDALGGAPGIYSARYMGHETSYTLKMERIMEKMKDVPEEERTARFTAAVAAVVPKGLNPSSDESKTLAVTASMEGRIGHSIAGINGFGYDPFFYLPEYGKSSAEISREEKNAISHRGKAVRAMMERLKEYGKQA